MLQKVQQNQTLILNASALLFAFVRFPRDQEAETSEKKGTAKILRTPLLLLLTILLFLYVGAELGVSNWVSEYFVKVLLKD